MTENTIYLPDHVYTALRQRATELRKTPDDLVTEWVLEHLLPSEEPNVDEAFVEEMMAFDRLRPSLLEHYADQFVAIYQGKVVASGDDQLALLEQVHERYGPVSCYIDKVGTTPVRKVRIPSVWVVRQ